MRHCRTRDWRELSSRYQPCRMAAVFELEPLDPDSRRSWPSRPADTESVTIRSLAGHSSTIRTRAAGPCEDHCVLTLARHRKVIVSLIAGAGCCPCSLPRQAGIQDFRSGSPVDQVLGLVCVGQGLCRRPERTCPSNSRIDACLERQIRIEKCLHEGVSERDPSGLSSSRVLAT